MEANIPSDGIFRGPKSLLRSPERLKLLEVDRVVDLSLEGIQVDRVLDVGTGTGIFAEAFAGRGLTTYGVDHSSEMVVIAKSHAPAADFHQAEATDIPFDDNYFDLVFMGLVLHEIADPMAALKEARRLSSRRVAVLEWAYREEELGPPMEHRVKPEDLAALAVEAGYAGSEALQLEHLVLYRLGV